ncbi:undecaprenyl-diphosphatase [Candidatus Nanohalovita haloferacivicina]|uniref:undecaprenyl-diphosphatase n=1 Tax=Candidatus Nanohalovita haloferacivicina TaxID=2978046 RepID=UPI00325FAC7C|nr:Undecaprenyl-diphosphatase [Candidatus Nanohalobia archaeon BNXNv]
MLLGEAFYTTLFTLHGNPAIDSLMTYFAEYLVLFVPLTLVYLWFQGRTGEEDSLYSFYTVVAGLAVSYGMGLIYSHGNPSTVFDTLVAQKPENAFPSQHTTVVVASALAYFRRDRRNLGLLMAVAAFLTGIARIYIGEHWPVDILGSAVAASLGLGVAYLSWDGLEPVWTPALDLYDRVFDQVVARLKELR